MIIHIIELLGTFAFAISGIRHAAAKQFDWFGGYVCGVAVAIGGGTIRDVMLGTTPFWMTTPIYLICTAVALLTAYSGVFRSLDGAFEECVVCVRYTGSCIVYDSRYSEKHRLRTTFLGSHHYGLYHRFGWWRDP